MAVETQEIVGEEDHQHESSLEGMVGELREEEFVLNPLQ
jgi:hypothetical protein